jgi:Chondroitinase B
VQVLVSGDDNRNASISVRYRQQGASAWRDGLPLFHVRPAVVIGDTVPEQFAGSLFDLMPATTYDIELHAVDPDGLDKTWTTTGTTRPIPADPQSPNVVNVTDAASLNSALGNARPGDVVTLASGTYAGNFTIQASGTPQNPIVIRAASEEGAILDGGGCTGCNVLEVYGSYVHVENLTLRNAERALRFQGTGATENVVQRVHISNVTLGIGSKDGQKNFYICDNTLEGRLTWPAVYEDDGGVHATTTASTSTVTGTWCATTRSADSSASGLMLVLLAGLSVIERRRRALRATRPRVAGRACHRAAARANEPSHQRHTLARVTDETRHLSRDRLI